VAAQRMQRAAKPEDGRGHRMGRSRPVPAALTESSDDAGNVSNRYVGLASKIDGRNSERDGDERRRAAAERTL
jgi:hypothetical protein